MKPSSLTRKESLRDATARKHRDRQPVQPPDEGPQKRSRERARPLKRSQPKRDWTQARIKVEHADCRLCAPDENCGPVEAAHVIGRERDRPSPCHQCAGRGLIPAGTTFDGTPPDALGPCSRCHGTGASSTFLVHPDSVIPLGRGHHQRYDAHEVDVLPVLTLEEQLRAVEDAGGLELARQRTCPSQYPAGQRWRPE